MACPQTKVARALVERKALRSLDACPRDMKHDRLKARRTMDLFEELRAVAMEQSIRGEFPVWLLADILEIAGTPERYAEKLDLVEMLIVQISDFDPYAGAGCFFVGAWPIQTTIRKIQN